MSPALMEAYISGAGKISRLAMGRESAASQVEFNVPEPGKIDDGVVLGILARCRAAGFDAYVLPQPPELPMANRREDVLVQRP